MANVIFYDMDKRMKEVEIRNGHTILRAAKQGRIPLRHKCGGKASCTTCKVIIENQDGVTETNEIEKLRLGEEQVKKGMRLSCQTKVFGTATVKIPEDPYKAKIRELIEKQKNDR